MLMTSVDLGIIPYLATLSFILSHIHSFTHTLTSILTTILVTLEYTSNGRFTRSHSVASSFAASGTFASFRTLVALGGTQA
jgi:hypothetical protein